MCVLILTPPLVFIGGSHPGNEAKLPWSTNHETPRVTESRWGPWAATTWSGNHCWGLDRRECARRLIPASKKSPNLSAGLRCWVTSAHEGCSVPTKTPGTEKLTFGTEGEGRTLRSTSLRYATCEASKESPSGDRRRQSIAPSAGRR